MHKICIMAFLMLLHPSVTTAKTHRSHHTPHVFMHSHPCPGGRDRGHITGSCHGYVRDHIVPLCANGPDTVANMQWQSVAEGRRKDALERRQCRHR
jgi:hypothetical protein